MYIWLIERLCKQTIGKRLVSLTNIGVFRQSSNSQVQYFTKKMWNKTVLAKKYLILLSAKL